MRTRVLIVDDHPHAREAISDILSEDESFEIIGFAESGEDAVLQTEMWMPDLILLDIHLPGQDGLATTREIKLKFPYVKIVLVTVSDNVAYLFEALKQGAQGYLLKNLEPGIWLEYLRAVASEEAPMTSELALRILQEFSLQKPNQTGHHPLTNREREILDLVAQGMTNREIAKALDISDQTVKNHLKNIMHKLHLENRVQLTRYAMEQGWI
ncbi:response regulator transcription factor [Paenibacillus motobuensis]|uniref:response regulator n=1 Tax=Paenibacillus TaxID=44249 RepID=UPI0020410532|nr:MULTISPECIES: response regulator transcription factor [Paenibacillus]MCM3038120.1 response regulator transcription factor [Paenibacillus lutimineralis]MCM3645224.1 response regulator transcription factor [Paenibacillus motobuensis]